MYSVFQATKQLLYTLALTKTTNYLLREILEIRPAMHVTTVATSKNNHQAPEQKGQLCFDYLKFLSNTIFYHMAKLIQERKGAF